MKEIDKLIGRPQKWDRRTWLIACAWVAAVLAGWAPIIVGIFFLVRSLRS